MDKRLEPIKEKLEDKIDEYFPKIEPIKGNKGRGEAIMIVAIALIEFEKLLKEIEGGDK